MICGEEKLDLLFKFCKENEELLLREVDFEGCGHPRVKGRGRLRQIFMCFGTGGFSETACLWRCSLTQWFEFRVWHCVLRKIF